MPPAAAHAKLVPTGGNGSGGGATSSGVTNTTGVTSSGVTGTPGVAQRWQPGRQRRFVRRHSNVSQIWGFFRIFLSPSPPDRAPCEGGVGFGEGGRERPPDLGCWAWGRCAAPPTRRCRPLPKSSQPGIILLCCYITADKREEKHPKRARGATATAQNRWQRLVPAWGHRHEATCAPTPGWGHPSAPVGAPGAHKGGSPPKCPPKQRCDTAGGGLRSPPGAPQKG